MTRQPRVGSVAWAVQPGGNSNSRAARLIAGLSDAGIVDPDARYYFHGRADGAGAAVNAGRVLPKIAAETRSSAVLSPVFDPTAIPGIAWVDCYDDWSIAPDINPLHRRLAARTYRRISRLPEDVRITVNSPYMAARVKGANAVIVPNGVDERIARLHPEGDSRLRLVMLGNFFDGRTDWRLILDIARAVKFDEIVIGRPGASKSMQSVIDSLRADYGSRLVVSEWIDDAQLARMSGARTIALIPHTVSDYTLSQDLMKVYQLIGLGIRVVCPRMLWPAHLSDDHAFLVDFGVSLSAVADWSESSSPSEGERQSFIKANSWTARARMVEHLLEGIRS